MQLGILSRYPEGEIMRNTASEHHTSTSVPKATFHQNNIMRLQNTQTFHESLNSLDNSKVFGKVWHIALLSKLSFLTPVCTWIKNFPSDWQITAAVTVHQCCFAPKLSSKSYTIPFPHQ